MEFSAREYNQHPSRIAAAARSGETVVITRNGEPDLVITKYGAHPKPPYRTDPMGEDPLWEEPPTLDLPAPSVEDQEAMLRDGFGRD